MQQELAYLPSIKPLIVRPKRNKLIALNCKPFALHFLHVGRVGERVDDSLELALVLEIEVVGVHRPAGESAFVAPDSGFVEIAAGFETRWKEKAELDYIRGNGERYGGR